MYKWSDLPTWVQWTIVIICFFSVLRYCSELSEYAECRSNPYSSHETCRYHLSD